MNGSNFTEFLRAALARGHASAVAAGLGYIATWHLLPELVRTPDSGAAALLRSAGVAPDAPARHLGPPPASPRARVTGPDLPYAEPARRALAGAIAEAARYHHDYVGTEHLLLAMLYPEPPRRGLARFLAALDRPDPARRALLASGVTLDRLREMLPTAATDPIAAARAPDA